MEEKIPPVKIFLLLLPLTFFGLASCSSSKKTEPKKPKISSVANERRQLAKQILAHPRITLMKRQVSGRYDGASAYENILAASQGSAAKRSSYGHAPGGYKTLDVRMLRCMKRLADDGYSFRVTSIAGGSHSRNSRHYVGVAFDVDKINGIRVRNRSCPHWAFQKRTRAYGATEVLGPGKPGHSGHVHVGYSRP